MYKEMILKLLNEGKTICGYLKLEGNIISPKSIRKTKDDAIIVFNEIDGSTDFHKTGKEFKSSYLYKSIKKREFIVEEINENIF